MASTSEYLPVVFIFRVTNVRRMHELGLAKRSAIETVICFLQRMVRGNTSKLFRTLIVWRSRGVFFLSRGKFESTHIDSNRKEKCNVRLPW